MEDYSNMNELALKEEIEKEKIILFKLESQIKEQEKRKKENRDSGPRIKKEIDNKKSKIEELKNDIEKYKKK